MTKPVVVMVLGDIIILYRSGLHLDGNGGGVNHLLITRSLLLRSVSK
jgi:hypothetical protein